MKNITVLLLFLIVVLGAILRFYRLGDVPSGFHRDEAFLGYNAYSIFKTAKDMNGTFLPLHLKSFIYSPAGYSYFSIPFIKLFDLSAFSVRFPSAFFGTLTILVAYFFTKELFRRFPLANSYSLITAILLAISPWHINLSRTATEDILVGFFISLGVLLFLLSLRKGSKLLLVTSFLSFGITLFIYQAARAFLPIFIPFLVLVFLWPKVEKKKLFLLGALFFVTIVTPLIFILSSKDLSLRIRTVSLFATEGTQLTIDEQIREDGISGLPGPVARAFHNKLINYSSRFLKNYFSHFSFDFFFADQGLPIRYKVPNMGLLYLFELPFLLLGAWLLLQKGERIGLFLIGWVLLVPFGSALTFDDVPNLQRTVIVFPALSIVGAIGVWSIVRVRDRYYSTSILMMLGLAIVTVYSFLFYLHQYYVQQLVHQPWHRQEGYKELVKKVNNILPNYKKAIITNRESAPTIFFLFYRKYDPFIFQEETRNTNMKDFDRINFSKYVFSEEECPLKEFEDVDKITGEIRIVNSGEKDVLYVNYGVCKIPEKTARLIDTIKRKDQTVVFQILEVKQ